MSTRSIDVVASAGGAAAAPANLFKMKEHGRHRSLEMVCEYVRDHERFRDHVSRHPGRMCQPP